jgi:small-conductance mechanosensitive channel
MASEGIANSESKPPRAYLRPQIFARLRGRGIGHGRGRCRKSRPERVRPAPARLGLPVERLTFLAVVIAEAVGLLTGRRGLALRFAGEAAVAAAVAVLEAVVDPGVPRRCRRGSVDRHQRHARNRNRRRRSQPVDSAQFHSPLVRSPFCLFRRRAFELDYNFC